MNAHPRQQGPLRRVPVIPDADAQREAVVDTFVRTSVALAHQAFDKNINALDYVSKTWGSAEARSAELITRAVSLPAMTTATGWAAELAHVATQFLAALTPVSAGAALLNRGLQLRFDGLKNILLPTIAQGVAAFIGEGKPIPVVQFQTAAGVTLTPHSLKLITGATYEMLVSSDAESIFRAVLIESAARGLDAALFSANAATADAPAGLLNGISPATPSSSSVLTDAMMADLSALGGAVARVAGDNIAFIAAPEQALAMRLMVENLEYPVLSTAALPAKSVVAVAANALVSGFAPLPEIDISRESTLHWETAPAEIVGSGGVIAAPTGSLAQSDRIALRMKMQAAWALRASNAIAFANNVAW